MFGMERNIARRIVTAWLVIAGCLASVMPAAAQSQARVTRSFAQLGQGSMTATTMYGSVSYYFPLPAGRVPVEGTQLELITSHSPLLEPTRSTMTVIVNGRSVASTQLTRANQDYSRLVVPLPTANEGGNAESDGTENEGTETETVSSGEAADFDATGYFVQVRFMLRLTTDECEEVNNPAQWATVHDESMLRLVTLPAPNPPGMAALDRYFVPQQQLMALPALVLPNDLTPAELQAAGLAAFQIGRWAAAAGMAPALSVNWTDDFTGDFAQVAASDMANGDMDGSAIVVAEGSRLPTGSEWGNLIWDGSAFTRADVAAPADHGVIAFDADAPQLLLSGAGAVGVVDAAEALVRPARRALLTGTHTIVSGVAVTTALPPAWVEGAASFAQLGVTEAREVSGPGEHQIDFFFRRPPGWDLRSGSVLDLALATSPALQPDTSWVAVRINGYDVGSQPLVPSAEGDEQRYTFALPDELLTAGIDGTPVRDLNVSVRLLLSVPQRECEFVNPDSAWASVSPTSAWRLRYSTDTGLDLGRFPWPLLSSPDQADAWPSAIVLPDAPESADVAAALQMMATLGRWADGAEGPLPALVTADALNDTLREQYSLILLGDAERNSVTMALSESVTSVRDNALPPAYQLGDNSGPLYLHLVESPWQDTRSVLVLSGSSAAALQFGASALGTLAVVDRLRGELAVLSPGMAPSILQDDRPVTAPEALAPQVTLPLIERIPAWQIVGAVVLGVLIALVLVFLFGLLRRRRAVG